jgi:hypothetical protein
MSRRSIGSRLPAAAGVGAVVLFLIADFLAGELPSFDDPAATIVAFYQEHRTAVLAGVVLSGIASALVVWLVAGVAHALRESGESGLGTVALAAGIAAVSMGVAGDVLSGSLAQVARDGDPDFVRGIYQIGGFFVEKSSWLAALVALASGLAARRSLPRWYATTSLAAAPFIALGGIALGSSGFLAPLGGLALIAFLALLAWILASSVLLWRADLASPA